MRYCITIETLRIATSETDEKRMQVLSVLMQQWPRYAATRYRSASA